MVNVGVKCTKVGKEFYIVPSSDGWIMVQYTVLSSVFIYLIIEQLQSYCFDQEPWILYFLNNFTNQLLTMGVT